MIQHRIQNSLNSERPNADIILLVALVVSKPFPKLPRHTPNVTITVQPISQQPTTTYSNPAPPIPIQTSVGFGCHRWIVINTNQQNAISLALKRIIEKSRREKNIN